MLYTIILFLIFVCLLPFVMIGVLIVGGLMIFILPERFIYSEDLISNYGENKFFDYKAKLYRYYVNLWYVRPKL